LQELIKGQKRELKIQILAKKIFSHPANFILEFFDYVNLKHFMSMILVRKLGGLKSKYIYIKCTCVLKLKIIRLRVTINTIHCNSRKKLITFVASVNEK